MSGPPVNRQQQTKTQGLLGCLRRPHPPPSQHSSLINGHPQAAASWVQPLKIRVARGVHAANGQLPSRQKTMLMKQKISWNARNEPETGSLMIQPGHFLRVASTSTGCASSARQDSTPQGSSMHAVQRVSPTSQPRGLASQCSTQTSTHACKRGGSLDPEGVPKEECRYLPNILGQQLPPTRSTQRPSTLCLLPETIAAKTVHLPVGAYKRTCNHKARVAVAQPNNFKAWTTHFLLLLTKKPRHQKPLWDDVCLSRHELAPG